MKRYLVFGGLEKISCSGWEDLVGYFDTIDKARQKLAERFDIKWYQIVDIETGEIV